MIPSKSILKIVTCGHVDDGKSTLIGRLLYETNALKEDQLAHITQKSNAMGYDYIDLSLATDGLLTEREQGITIDVSHIYFSDENRRYVIADSPGHEEYTRNMVTGASNADCALLLVDVRNGITKQTVRHLTILSLLNIKQIAVVINKVDLIDYNEETIKKLEFDLRELVDNYDSKPNCVYIPISALKGDNVTAASEEMKWYDGPTLLEFLKHVPVDNNAVENALLQVQTVIRPKTYDLVDYRGYAGKVRSGALKVGDSVTLFPSGRTSQIAKLEKYSHEIDTASAGENVTVLLDDEHDLSRGDSIYVDHEDFKIVTEVNLTTCWMDKTPIANGNVYSLQHGIGTCRATVLSVNHVYDLSDHTTTPANQLELNEIGSITFLLSKPMLASAFTKNKNNGAVIVINEQTNATAGAGFIELGD